MGKMFLGLILCLALAGCGGSGASDWPDHLGFTNPPPPVQLTYYKTDLRTEKQLTFGEYNQGVGGSAYGNGVYLLVYEDDRDNVNGVYGIDIWASLLDGNLNVIKEFPIYKHEGKDYGARVFFDKANGRFVVSWISYGALISNKTSIMVSFVSTAGNVSDAVALPVAVQYASDATVTQLSGGYGVLFMDTWVTYDNTVGSAVLKFATLDWDLNVNEVKQVTDDMANGTKVAPLWSSMDCSQDVCLFSYAMTKAIIGRGGEHIFARVITLANNSLGPEMQLSDGSPTQAGANTRPYVLYGGGRFLVLWGNMLSPQGSASTDMMGKIVFPDGSTGETMVVSDFRPDHSKTIDTGLNGVVESAVAVYRQSDNAFHVFWADTRGGKPLDGRVFYRKVDGNFTSNPTVLINDQPYDQKMAGVCVGAGDKLMVSWLDHGTYGSQDWFGLLY